MPYIKQEVRDIIDPVLVKLPDDLSIGDVNYIMTQVCCKYLKQKGLNYENINAVVGALECAKLEAYRRVAVGYENRKIDLNGDAYPVELTYTSPAK